MQRLPATGRLTGDEVHAALLEGGPATAGELALRLRPMVSDLRPVACAVRRHLRALRREGRAAVHQVLEPGGRVRWRGLSSVRRNLWREARALAALRRLELAVRPHVPAAWTSWPVPAAVGALG